MMEKSPHESIEQLLQGLQSKEYHVRKTSAEKMGKLGTVDEQALAVLTSVAESDLNTYVRNAARQSYLALGGQEQRLSEDAWPHIPQEKRVLDPEVSSNDSVMAEAPTQDGISRPEQPTRQEPAEKESTPLGDAVKAGFFVGGVAGLASHYLADGKLTFPIFIVAYILIISGIKGGWGKLVGFIVAAVVSALVAALWSM
jgi:hypothetical protein